MEWVERLRALIEEIELAGEVMQRKHCPTCKQVIYVVPGPHDMQPTCECGENQRCACGCGWGCGTFPCSCERRRREDADDVKAAKAAMAEIGGRLPYAVLRKELLP